MRALGSTQGVQQLMGAKPLQAVPGARQCAHPSRPSPLRRLVESAEDTCVELLVAEHNSHPCCLLPRAAAGTWGAQTRGLLGLLSLETLDASTLTNSLAAVEGQLSSTCASCPAVALESLRESPPLCAYLERCLELTRENPGLGPAPAVLLLQIVSRLNYGANPAMREPFYRRFYLPLQVALEAAAELHAEAFTPQVCLAIFEAWAAMGATPMHSRAFGLAVRGHIKTGRFTPQEAARLLSTMAEMRTAKPSYRPCQYDVCDLCGALLASDIQQLSTRHLASVASALGCFSWPVYQCVLPLLTAVAQEGARRGALGALSPPAATALLEAALASARALNPRIGAELEAQVAGWQAQARLATGNSILRFPGEGAPSPRADTASEVAPALHRASRR